MKWLLYSLLQPTSSWTIQNLQYVQDGCIQLYLELIWAAWSHGVLVLFDSCLHSRFFIK